MALPWVDRLVHRRHLLVRGNLNKALSVVGPQVALCAERPLRFQLLRRLLQRLLHRSPLHQHQRQFKRFRHSSRSRVPLPHRLLRSKTCPHQQ